jgi:hypothetical protein
MAGMVQEQQARLGVEFVAKGLDEPSWLEVTLHYIIVRYS